MTRRIAWSALACWCVVSVSAARGAEFPGAPLTRQLQMSACYVKETTDRAWKVRITGDLPRGPGIYVIVYDEAGEVVKRDAVPFGTYDVAKPYTLAVPADGKAQQYVIKLLGQQDNLNGMALPLTDLPLEVYGDGSYSLGYGTAAGQKRMVAFQVADEQPLHLQGWSGNYRILDAQGATVFDSAQAMLPEGDPTKKGGPRYVEMIVTLKPGRTYWFEPYGVMYWARLNGRLFLTFDPPRWFEPKLSWTLDERPWWKGMP
jgi:hypothetical protein